MDQTRKVFDIAPPSAQATTRPIIAQQKISTPDPMVNQPAQTFQTPTMPEPQIENIPVRTAPAEPMPAQQISQDTGAIKPALPGAPENDFSNIPKFGELQPKIDAHPLFSGTKEERIKVRKLPFMVKVLLILIILFVAAYLVIDSGLVRGASHLPFHIFKQTQALSAPAINS